MEVPSDGFLPVYVIHTTILNCTLGEKKKKRRKLQSKKRSKWLHKTSVKSHDYKKVT